MRIGITYDLKQAYLAAGYAEREVAEFDDPATVEAVESTLAELGHQPQRVGHLYDLAARLTAGERWDLVFNFAEGVRGFGREAAVPALLEAYGVPYTFSDPLTLAVCLHKGFAKRVARDRGVPTPEFAVVDSEEAIDGVELPYPLFVKPIAEGSSKGISRTSAVETPRELRAACRRLLERHRQPVLVERYLPGAELTVGILGTGGRARAIGVMEVVFGPGAEPGGYTYRNKTVWEGIISQRLAAPELAAAAEPIALSAWRGLGCRDAGRVDLKLDEDGTPQFLEVNPLAGIAPGHSDLTLLCELVGMPYRDLLRQIVDSAGERRLDAVRLPVSEPAPVAK